MSFISLDTDIQYLKGVGPKVARVLKNLDVEKVEDLLTLVPRRYVKRSLVRDLKIDEEVRVCGRIIGTHKKQTRKGRIFVISLSDDTGIIDCSFFNYPDKAISKFDWGKLIEVEGTVSLWGQKIQLVNPVVSFSPSTGQNLLPIYPLSQWLTHTYIRKLVKTALNSNMPIPETLPSYIIDKEGLLAKETAIWALHFPPEFDTGIKAKQRFEFEELFYLELLIALQKRRARKKGIGFKKGSNLARKFFDAFTKDFQVRDNPLQGEPFELTKAQIKVLTGIYRDMESSYTMHRLLQGDVGSGKTIVAVLSMLKAVDSNYQVAFMAPTEILAEQHYLLLKGYLPKIGVRLKLLIGSLKPNEKREIKKEIENGECDVIVGTHALLEEDVKFKNLGFIIIDEQHKFGVMQRLRLREKSPNCDFLIMTATPIPRSLSLTIYGDLDVSVIDEMPPQTGKITTKWIVERDISKAWELVKDELNKERQCYIVYPLIEESEKLDLKAAENEHELLRKGVFKDYKVALIHGRMKGKEKEKVMSNFRKGKIRVLVATTVIEVGVDVPNATCMVIEHSERFGLAELHQLRGRLRRGKDQSYCILVSGYKISDIARERLLVLTKETDGFKIAEKDLQFRGPGEFFGTKQSGLPELKIADPISNIKTLTKARNWAFRIIDEDSSLAKPENNVIRETFFRKYKDKMNLISAG